MAYTYSRDSPLETALEKVESELAKKETECAFNEQDLQLFKLKLYVFIIHLLRGDDMDRAYGKSVCPVTRMAFHFLTKDVEPYLASRELPGTQKQLVLASISYACAIGVTERYLIPGVECIVPGGNA